MLPRQGYKAIPWQNETEVGRNMPRQSRGYAMKVNRLLLLRSIRRARSVFGGNATAGIVGRNFGLVICRGRNLGREVNVDSSTSLCAATVEMFLCRSPLKCMYTLHLAIVPEGMNI
ncbi:hypothetical protein V6N12_009878 [Hibiscus sabdariffa]|uniref:Uncharacterized protein n=1 Tax=Hibiscus sabdariffa TaxID=183260 RepID=A0ABR2EFL6_9ROSI